MTFIKEFENPPAKYRIKPFWFWNGDMKKDEIDHQIKEMAEKGLGGVFICARQGLTIPYLSKEWFDRVKYAADKAKEYGLETWLYDEYPYPSGMSGGEVLLENPEAEHMMLHHQSLEAVGNKKIHMELGWTDIIYAKAISINEDKTLNWDRKIDLEDMIGNLQTTEIYQTTGLTAYNNKRFFTYGPNKILEVNLPEGDWKIEVYAQAPMGDFKYYGGFLDPCNSEAVQTFIRTTHERYSEFLGEGFGKSIHGMFSDEVSLLSPIPWSKLLLKEFEEKKGYSLKEVMPAIHDSSFEDSTKIRYDLYDIAHQLLVENYHKQVADWCKENNLFYATEVPSMRMSTQKYSTVIGGDTAHEKLGKPLEWIYDTYIKKYRSNAKAVSSLTRQLDLTYAMIESFHSVGWTMTLQDAKWMIDRLGASGINFYNVHAFFYTIEAITKHDAPPSQFLQNPYWKHYKTLADYVGRMGVFVTNTEAVTEIAVLDPVSSLWAHLGNPFQGFPYEGEDEDEKERCDQIRDDWVHVCKTLLFNQLDYDHLDTEIMENAIVEDGKMKIGRASYSILILPPSTCIESKATKKIKEFISKGGHVLSLGMLPHKNIDDDAHSEKTWQGIFGTGDCYEKSYWGECLTEPIKILGEQTCFLGASGSVEKAGMDNDWINWCREITDSPFEIIMTEEDKKNFITTIRKDSKDNFYVFMANQGSNNVTVTLCQREIKNYCVNEYTLEDGKTSPLDTEGDKLIMIFVPFESKCIQFSQEVDRKPIKTQVEFKKSHFTIGTKEPMKVEIEGKNTLILDEFEISRNKKDWYTSTVKTFIEQCASEPLLENKDYQFKGDFGIPKEVSINYPLTVYYRLEFEAEEIPGDFSILMDENTIKSDFIMQVNGHNIYKKDFTPHFVNDQNNIICNISDIARVGKNKIDIEVTIRRDSDGIRDPLYLYGSFGVIEKYKESETKLKLIPKPTESSISRNYIDGFPYYSGTFTFTKDIPITLEDVEEFFTTELDLGNTCCDVIEIIINGNSLGVKSFTPYIWEGKKDWLIEGYNKLEIKITNTLGNMLDGTYFDYEEHQLVKI